MDENRVYVKLKSGNEFYFNGVIGIDIDKMGRQYILRGKGKVSPLAYIDMDSVEILSHVEPIK